MGIYHQQQTATLNVGFRLIYGFKLFHTLKEDTQYTGCFEQVGEIRNKALKLELYHKAFIT